MPTLMGPVEGAAAAELAPAEGLALAAPAAVDAADAGAAAAAELLGAALGLALAAGLDAGAAVEGEAAGAAPPPQPAKITPATIKPLREVTRGMLLLLSMLAAMLHPSVPLLPPRRAFDVSAAGMVPGGLDPPCREM